MNASAARNEVTQDPSVQKAAELIARAESSVSDAEEDYREAQFEFEAAAASALDGSPGGEVRFEKASKAKERAGLELERAKAAAQGMITLHGQAVAQQKAAERARALESCGPLVGEAVALGEEIERIVGQLAEKHGRLLEVATKLHDTIPVNRKELVESEFIHTRLDRALRVHLRRLGFTWAMTWHGDPTKIPAFSDQVKLGERWFLAQKKAVEALA